MFVRLRRDKNVDSRKQTKEREKIQAATVSFYVMEPVFVTFCIILVPSFGLELCLLFAPGATC